MDLMNLSDKNGETGFDLACHNGHENIVQILCQHGFDIHITDNYGYTTFHTACLCNCENVVKILLRHGFDMNILSASGKTGFHCACEKGHKNIVKHLIQEGFDINTIIVTNGQTGFHLACIKNQASTAVMLLENGIDFDICDFHGSTGLDYFQEVSGTSLNKIIKHRIEEIQSLPLITHARFPYVISKLICDFTMESYTEMSIHNLLRIFPN